MENCNPPSCEESYEHAQKRYTEARGWSPNTSQKRKPKENQAPDQEKRKPKQPAERKESESCRLRKGKATNEWTENKRRQ